MEHHIQLFDKSLYTLTIGSCAPGPLMKILPIITGSLPDLTISSTIEQEDVLLKGLHTAAYQLIILSHPVENEDIICQKYLTEHLYLSINIFHPAATNHSIKFSQVDGQNFIMYAKVGIWEQIVRNQMPKARFFKQEELDTVGELASSSDLPMFSTNITMEEIPSRVKNRINIPFSDKDAEITFCLLYTKENANRFKRLNFIINNK